MQVLARTSQISSKNLGNPKKLIKLLKTEDPDAHEQGLLSAGRRFTSNKFSFGGDDTDVYLQTAFRGVEGLLSGLAEEEERLTFAGVSLEVFGPLVEHLRRNG